MVLFGLVMGLGMLVDDGIVVVDNVFANMKKEWIEFLLPKLVLAKSLGLLFHQQLQRLWRFYHLHCGQNYGKVHEIFPNYINCNFICFIVCGDGRKCGYDWWFDGYRR